jgi:hypothetical protein
MRGCLHREADLSRRFHVPCALGYCYPDESLEQELNERIDAIVANGGSQWAA